MAAKITQANIINRKKMSTKLYVAGKRSKASKKVKKGRSNKKAKGR